MKGEVFQLCSVITAAKNALNTQTFIQYEPLSYERGTVFQFVPEAEGQKGETIEGVDSWYARCVYNGMEDVKILAPTAVKDRRVLGFVNTSQNIMLCFYPDDVIHMWMPRWVMDKDRKGWHIIYTEKIWRITRRVSLNTRITLRFLRRHLRKSAGFPRSLALRAGLMYLTAPLPC